MAGLLRAALATLVAPPPSVVDLARRLRFRDRAVVDIDLAALSARGTSGAGDRVLLALEWLRNDPMVRGVRIRLDGARGSWATLQAWHAGIRRLVSGGTPVFVEVGAVGNTELFLASAASRIFMLPAGSVEATGLATRMHFFGDVLERLGVQVEVFAAGDYKSAGETLSRSCPSAANREAVQALLDDLQDQLVGAVAAGRGLEVQAVRDALAAAPFTADRALQLGLVDDLAHHDQVRERLEGDLPCEPVHVSFGTWWRWVRFRDLWRRMAGAGAPVAVVRLRGPVVERRAEPGGRDVIAADRVVRLLERVREADAVRGVLLTVDSGGGSVLASERIWRAVQRLQEAKPVVALFQGVAASGGYYLAAPIRSIFVHPGTVTGSIGVIGARFVYAAALARLGVHGATLGTGPGSDSNLGARALRAPERRRLEALVSHYYDLFIDRVAAGRRKPRRAIEPLARGRVWSGRAAQERGLVDRLGTYHDALRHLYKQVGVYPRPWLMPRWDHAQAASSPGQRLLRTLLAGAPDLLSAQRPGLATAFDVLDRLRLPPAVELMVGQGGDGVGEPLALLEWDVDPS